MNRSPQSPGTSTFFDRAQNSEVGGRYAEAQRREQMARPQIIGTSPSANYPRLPFNPFENDQAPEPTIDQSLECGPIVGVAMGEPFEAAQAAQILSDRSAPQSADVASAPSVALSSADVVADALSSPEVAEVLSRLVVPIKPTRRKL